MGKGEIIIVTVVSGVDRERTRFYWTINLRRQGMIQLGEN